jgi:hypothetical protein
MDSSSTSWKLSPRWSKPSTLRKELEGVHPRVFMTQQQIDALKVKAKSHGDLWQTAVGRVRALNVEPPARLGTEFQTATGARRSLAARTAAALRRGRRPLPSASMPPIWLKIMECITPKPATNAPAT